MSSVDLVSVARGIFGCGNRPTESFFCLRRSARVQIHLSKADQRIGILGVQFYGTLQFLLSLLGIVPLQGDIADHIMSAGIVWIELQLCFELGNGFAKTGIAVALEISHCQEIVGNFSLRVLRKRLVQLSDGLVQIIAFAISLSKQNMNLGGITKPERHLIEKKSSSHQIL